MVYVGDAFTSYHGKGRRVWAGTCEEGASGRHQNDQRHNGCNELRVEHPWYANCLPCTSYEHPNCIARHFPNGVVQARRPPTDLLHTDHLIVRATEHSFSTAWVLQILQLIYYNLNHERPKKSSVPSDRRTTAGRKPTTPSPRNCTLLCQMMPITKGEIQAWERKHLRPGGQPKTLVAPGANRNFIDHKMAHVWAFLVLPLRCYE